MIFTQSQRTRALIWLSLFHLFVITISNYLVQLPTSFLGLHTTWGAFSFPLIFLSTDLTVRIFGAPLARRIILAVMFPALIISYTITTLWFQGEWQGINGLNEFNVFVARIACASFMAYVLGQILDVFIFDRLRQKGKWWLAPAASTFLSNIFDTIAFFYIAFHGSHDPFMANNWAEIALTDYSFKIIICILFLLPVYGTVLNTLLSFLTDKTEQLPTTIVRIQKNLCDGNLL